MNKINYKIFILLICIVLISMYALSIIYAEKAHQIFALKNPIYNEELHNYRNLSRNFMSLYIVFMHLIPIPIFLLNINHRFKGLLSLNIIGIGMSILCLGIKIEILDYFSFKSTSDILQFLIILLSVNILYFLIWIIYKIKCKLMIIHLI